MDRYNVYDMMRTICVAPKLKGAFGTHDERDKLDEAVLQFLNRETEIYLV
jgi:hypothetical protein